MVVNSSGYTPLFSATRSNSPDKVKLLLELGLDANKKSSRGNTPLSHAAKYSSSPEILTLLLDAGADAKVKDRYGKTALDYATDKGRFKGTKEYWRLYYATNE